MLNMKVAFEEQHMLTQGDLPEIVSDNLARVPEPIVIAENIPSESAQIKKLAREKALEKIKSDLEIFNKNKIIREVLANLSTIQLTFAEGNREDAAKINQYLRELLLKLLPVNDTNFVHTPLHDAALHSLVLLANYWPLNDYEQNETGTGFNYICPWSMKPLDASNKIIFATGTQIHVSYLAGYYNLSLVNNFEDPLSQKSLPDLAIINFIAKDPTTLISAYINSPSYTTNKEIAISNKGGRWRTIGGLIPIVLVCAIIITALFVTIPPMAVLITGLALGMGSIITSKLGAFLGEKSKERQFNTFENYLRNDTFVSHHEINQNIEYIDSMSKSEILRSSLNDEELKNIEGKGVEIIPDQTVNTVPSQNDTFAVVTSLDGEFKQDAQKTVNTPAPRDEVTLDLRALAKTHTPRQMAVFSALNRLSLFRKKTTPQVQPVSTPTSENRFTA
jgi:hypothetical protein